MLIFNIKGDSESISSWLFRK